MQFIKHESSDVSLMAPFARSVDLSDAEVDDQGSLITIIVHTADAEVVDDGKIHVYYRSPLGSDRDIYVMENEDSSGAMPQFLYVQEGNSFEELQELVRFLGRHFYTLKGLEEEQNDVPKGTAFYIFTSQVEQKTSCTLEQYLREMLRSMGISEENIVHITAYANIFYVALVDQDTNPDPLGNYELLEFVGDLAAWKPMTDIFLEYAELHGIVMTEQVITAMHRSFSSKEKQAQIAKKLGLNVYLKKKGEITIDTYEDIFESFVGAMFLVNFHLRTLLSINLELHEVFLRWVYAGWDFSDFKEKPEITKFYEYMRVLAGKSVFKEMNINEHWFMKEERGTMQLIDSRLKQYILGPEGTDEELAIMDRFVKELFKLIRKPYKNDGEAYESRSAKYQKINDLIEEVIGLENIHFMANERNMADWDEHVKGDLVSIQGFDITSHIVSQRFVDKSRSVYYWVVQDKDGTVIYSTMDHNDSENPATLVDVIKKQLESRLAVAPTLCSPQSHNASNISTSRPPSSLESGRSVVPDTPPVVERVRYEPGKGQAFYLEIGDEEREPSRWFLRGTPAAIEAYVAKVYEEGTGRFYLVMTGLPEGDKPIEYDTRPRNYFKADTKFDLVRRLFAEQAKAPNVTELGGPRATLADEPRFELSDALYRYIGDRAAYGHTALIAVLNHQITNVHQLTDVRNFYRSKSLKKEITRLIGIRNAASELVEFDQLIGRNMAIAEKVITYIYLHVPIEPRVIYRPEARVKSLRMALFARASSARVSNARAPNTRGQASVLGKQSGAEDREHMAKRQPSVGAKMKSEIRVRDGKFFYETSNDLRLWMPIAGFDNERVKELFANWILAYERAVNPNIDTIRNSRFSSLPGFDTLRHAMEFKNVEEWQLFWNKRGVVELRYFTAGGKEVVYVSGSDIESINKHL